MRRAPVDVLTRPFQNFARIEASGGLLLMLFTLIALGWANSPWVDDYHSLWATKFTIGTASVGLSKPLLLWINDGLMAVFFLVVGLEIKRELLVGELASLKRAALPMVAAAGGMIAPALIYLAFNAGEAEARGWAIPVATDIAFALGVLALLGSRVPVAMKAFLTALAIADDIGGILVIAIFLTERISVVPLLAAGGILAGLVLANRLGVRSIIIYGILGVALWFAFLKSGVHATLAGVVLAFLIPARTKIESEQFVTTSRALLDHFERSSAPGQGVLSNHEQQDAVASLERICEEAETPLQRLEHRLHPWVVFGIMPLFALANAGVTVGSGFLSSIVEPVTFGVIFGLWLGKPIGITLAVWIAIKAGIAALPSGMSFRQMHAVTWIAGIGFTLALFIGELSFAGQGQEGSLEQAKVGILIGSLLAALVGTAILLFVTKPPPKPPATAPAEADQPLMNTG